MVEVCHIPCPLDCKLSDWSAWSACSASCGSGLQMRSKWLREKAFNGGRPCPRLDLKNQVRHCSSGSTSAASVTTCFMWRSRRHEHSWPVHLSTLCLCDIFICFQGNKSFRVIHIHIHRITTCQWTHMMYMQKCKFSRVILPSPAAASTVYTPELWYSAHISMTASLLHFMASSDRQRLWPCKTLPFS